MNNNFKGLVLIIIGMLFFIVHDTLIKLTVNDLSLLQILVFRAIVGSSIYTPSDVKTTKLIVNDMLDKPKFSYIRLDRNVLPDISPEANSSDYQKGFKIYGKEDKKKIALISHGKMLHSCLELYNKDKENFICVDIFRSKPFPKELPKEISLCKGIVVVDEQTPSGNLSSCIFEGFSSQNYFPKIISFWNFSNSFTY